MNLKQVTKELTKKRDKEDLSDSNLEFEAYIDGIKDCFNLINKPVETTNEQPLPTTKQIIIWIEEHYKLAQNEEFHFCPCLLGKPFYPDNNCQCGG